MNSILTDEMTGGELDAKRTRIRTFRYYLILMASLFFIGAILDLIVDFKTTSLVVFLTLTGVTLFFLLLSFLEVPHKLLLFLQMLFVLASSELQVLNNPTAYHVLVYWIGATPLIGAVILNIRESIFWTIATLAIIIFNGLYISDTLPSYEITLYPIRFMYAGLMFASLITIVTFLFTFTRFYNHKRLATQNLELFALTKEVEQKNQRLKDQHDQIVQINERLEGYNQHLEERVLERTEELEIKNKKLTEYAFINSHLLRGPLSRILGLVHLINLTELTDKEKELICHLNSAGDELDEVISKINKAIDSGHTFDRETIIKLKK